MTPQVLIVGAGPTGLAAATELARHGIMPQVIDAVAQPRQHSRALGINPRTLELLEPLGVTSQFLALGTQIPELHIHVADRQPITARFNRLKHRFNFLLTLSQTDTEKLLGQAAQGLGVVVQRQTELLHLTQHSQGVTALVQSPQGKREIQADVVLGADGSHSQVRSFLGVEMRGSTYAKPWTLADLVTDWPFSRQAIQIFVTPGRAVLAFPFVEGGQNLVRVVCSSGPVLEHLPPAVTVQEVLWQSEFIIHERLANSFSQGNAFLAGDAAHLHSPVGARGMNLGIEDAITFARLLAQERQQDYAHLRRPYAQHVVSLTSFQSRVLTTAQPFAMRLRDVMLPFLLGIPAFEQLALSEFAGLRSPQPPRSQL